MDPSSPKPDEADNPRLNPYAPPATAIAKAAPRLEGGVSRSLWIWGYAVGQLAALGADAAYLTVGAGSNGYGLALRLVSAIVGLAWLGSAYERVPRRLRLACSPGALVGRHFVPIYNLYWIFKAQSLLCDALDMLLLERDQRRGAPRGLAVAGCALVLVSRIASGLPGALFLMLMLANMAAWTMYMIAVERILAPASEGSARRVRAVCASCAHGNEIDAAFCARCGAEI